MRLVDTELLKTYRGPGLCGYCGRPCLRRDCAHVRAKGSGRVEHRLNLLGLGLAFDCGCHTRHHDGNRPTQADLVQKVSQREGVPVAVIGAFVDACRREPQPPKGEEHQRAEELLAECLNEV